MKELENDRTEASISHLERRMEECRIQYELYFMGQEKREPKKIREEVQKLLGQTRSANPKQTALKFRITTLTNRWQTLTRYWDRVNLERENGTYRRDLERAKRHMALPSAPIGAKPSTSDANQTNPQIDALPSQAAAHLLQASPSSPASNYPSSPLSSAAPAYPASASSPLSSAAPTYPASASSPLSSAAPAYPASAPSYGAVPASGMPSAYRPPSHTPQAPQTSAPLTPSLHQQRLQEIYQSYVETRRQCQEGTDGVSFQAIVKTIEKQIPRFQEKGYKDLDFQVVVKDGKAALKPVVKK